MPVALHHLGPRTVAARLESNPSKLLSDLRWKDFRTRRIRAVAPALIAVIALAGCSTGSQAPVPSPTPSATLAPTVEEVKASASAAGRPDAAFD